MSGKHDATPIRDGVRQPMDHLPPGAIAVSLNRGARLWDTSTEFLRERIADGSLPAYRAGRKMIRVRLDDLEALFRPVNPAAVELREAARRAAASRGQQ